MAEGARADSGTNRSCVCAIFRIGVLELVLNVMPLLNSLCVVNCWNEKYCTLDLHCEITKTLSDAPSGISWCHVTKLNVTSGQVPQQPALVPLFLLDSLSSLSFGLACVPSAGGLRRLKRSRSGQLAVFLCFAEILVFLFFQIMH